MCVFDGRSGTRPDRSGFAASRTHITATLTVRYTLHYCSTLIAVDVSVKREWNFGSSAPSAHLPIAWLFVLAGAAIIACTSPTSVQLSVCLSHLDLLGLVNTGESSTCQVCALHTPIVRHYAILKKSAFSFLCPPFPFSLLQTGCPESIGVGAGQGSTPLVNLMDSPPISG